MALAAVAPAGSALEASMLHHMECWTRICKASLGGVKFEADGSSYTSGCKVSPFTAAVAAGVLSGRCMVASVLLLVNLSESGNWENRRGAQLLRPTESAESTGMRSHKAARLLRRPRLPPMPRVPQTPIVLRYVCSLEYLGD